jgi:glycerophosphoryl diester phosphodiesterase
MRSSCSIIAHRGASGYLPEHTLESKALAYGMGADYIEQDVVATCDERTIVLHDIYLDDVTDVADVFPDRHRADGHYYAIDFCLDEIRTLRVHERRRPGTRERLFPDRFRAPTLGFRIATLAEEIELVQDLNRSTGRHVGIYPEVKDPAWHLRHQIDLSRLVLDELHRYGYSRREDLAYVQCFDAFELRRMRETLGSRLKLVQLLPAGGELAASGSSAALREIAEYAIGVGLPFDELVAPADHIDANAFCAATPLFGSSREAGLSLHAYTFRRDRVPAWAPTFEALLRYFLVDLSIEGLFCDHPDIAVGIRDSGAGGECQSP